MEYRPESPHELAPQPQLLYETVCRPPLALRATASALITGYGLARAPTPAGGANARSSGTARAPTPPRDIEVSLKTVDAVLIEMAVAAPADRAGPSVIGVSLETENAVVAETAVAALNAITVRLETVDAVVAGSAWTTIVATGAEAIGAAQREFWATGTTAAAQGTVKATVTMVTAVAAFAASLGAVVAENGKSAQRAVEATATIFTALANSTTATRTAGRTTAAGGRAQTMTDANAAWEILRGNP